MTVFLARHTRRVASQSSQRQARRQLATLSFAAILFPYLVWLVLMPLTQQYDLALAAWRSHHINEGHWNLYAYFAEQTDNFAVPGHTPAAYPFGFYLTTAAWLELLQRLGIIDYTSWTTPLNVLPDSPTTAFVLKLPYLVAHLLVGFILFKAAPSGWRWQAWAIWAWSLSPAYLLFMAQNDLPVALSMVAASALGAHAVKRQQEGALSWRKFAFASVAVLGLGATYKTAPLLLALPFALLLSRRWLERLLFVGVPAALFALAALPFLGTPAFINGALLNPEGTRVLSSASLFAQPVSLFLVTYVSLVLLLAFRAQSHPLDFWRVGAGVLGAMFLFSWTQFYWLVWLAPFIVGLAMQDSQRRGVWLGVWLVSEIVFGMLLFSGHRDWGFGLLGESSAQFRVAHLDFVLGTFAPEYARIFEMVWAVARSARAAALVVLVGVVFGSLLSSKSPLGISEPAWRVRRSELIPALGLPALICVILGSFVLFVSRNAVAQVIERRAVGEVVLSAEQPQLTQVLSPALSMGSAILLRFPTLPESLPLELCAQVGAQTTCALGQPVQGGRLFTGYFFRLDIPSSQGVPLRQFDLRLANASTGARLSLPLSPALTRQQEQHTVIHGEASQAGVLPMAVFRTFSPAQAMRDVVQWLRTDWRLAPLWLGVFAGVAGFIWRVVGQSGVRVIRAK